MLHKWGDTWQICSIMNNLSEVIIYSNTTFHIPVFQREFVWTDDEVDELFQAFLKILII